MFVRGGGSVGVSLWCVFVVCLSGVCVGVCVCYCCVVVVLVLVSLCCVVLVLVSLCVWSCVLLLCGCDVGAGLVVCY